MFDPADSAIVHETPDWVTVTVCPATVTVALREDVEVLAAAVAVTVPLPEPLPPVPIVSHVALLEAVHAQPDATVTPTEPLPPAATMFCVAGESATLQGAPACVTVTDWPPTVTVALRDTLDVLAVAVSVIVPLPEPLAPLVIDSHDALSDAVHVQPEPAVSVRVAVPPPTATLVVSGDTENEHVVPYANVSTDMALVPRPPGPTAATSAV